MRRIIHNTTAIATCLSLLAPQAVLAQSGESGQPPQRQQSQNQPQAQQPQGQADAGAACADGTAPPCAASQPATPEAIEREEVAPAPAQDASTDGSAGENAELGNTTSDVAPADPAPVPETDRAASPAPAVEAPAQESAPEGLTESEPATADEPVANRPQQTQEGANSGAPQATADDDLADALAKEAEAPAPEAETRAAEPATKAPAEADDSSDAAAKPAETPVAEQDQQPADGEAAGKPGDAVEGDPATDADALAAALAEKNGETDASSQDPSQTAAEPQADDTAQPAQRPADPAVPAQDESAGGTAAPGSKDSTPAPQAPEESASDAQLAGQPAQPTADVTAPEQGAKETEAAKEAAEAQVVAPVAALSDEGKGEVTEEQVTEDNSRSSAEDFATDLRDAMTAATGAPRQTSEATDDNDDSKSDLAKALLFGLGGVAVGSMLNNNRQVTLSTPDRVVVTRDDGSQQVIKDEVALLRRPGSTVATENYNDGSSRTIVTRADGSQIVTIRDADLRVLRRNLVSPDGTTVQLIDDTVGAEPVDIASLPAPVAGSQIAAGRMNEEELRAALFRETDAGRRFTLSQIRDIPQVRALAAPVNIDAITFETGSAAIKPDQAEQLSALGKVIRTAVNENPQEIFMVEGHTDTVGSDAANLALSDRRAESVALALTEYFDVPPENMVVQGYGEQFPKIRQEGDVRENRRAAVRRVTDLLQQASR